MSIEVSGTPTEGKKYAVIINGDTEARHLGNVDNAIKALEAEADYEIAVVSPERPDQGADLYAPPTQQGLDSIISGLKAKMDENDQLVVYITSHGGVDDEGRECTVLQNTCVPTLEIAQALSLLHYNQRAVVLDSCFSGAALTHFIDGKTSLVSLGAPGQVVSCQEFSPHFWSTQVKDANKDGVISVRERYEYALEKGQPHSSTQFYPGVPLSFSGKIPKNEFPAKNGDYVREANTPAELEELRKSLKDGQLALVMFSADWCGPCKQRYPAFEKFANEVSQGRFLTIHAEGIGEDAPWKQDYDVVSSYPTFAFMDHEGRLTRVVNEENPLAQLPETLLNDVDEVQKYYRDKLAQASPEELPELFISISMLGKSAQPFIPDLIKATYDQDSLISRYASLAIAQILQSGFQDEKFVSLIFRQILDEFENPKRYLPWNLILLIKAIILDGPQYLIAEKTRLKKIILEGNQYALSALVDIDLGEFVKTRPEIEKEFTEAFDERWKNGIFDERLVIASYYDAIGKNFDLSLGLPTNSQLASPFENKDPEAIIEFIERLSKSTKLVITFKDDIIPLLKHKNSEVKVAALVALSLMGIRVRSAHNMIRPLLKDPDLSVRAQAIFTLELIGAPNFNHRQALEELRENNYPLGESLARNTYLYLSFVKNNDNGFHLNTSVGFSSQNSRMGFKTELGASLRRRRWEFGLGFQYTPYLNLQDQQEDASHFMAALAQSRFHIFKYPQRIDPQILPLQVGLGGFIGQKGPWMIINPPGLGLDILLKRTKNYTGVSVGVSAKPRMVTNFSGKPEWGVDAEVGISGHF